MATGAGQWAWEEFGTARLGDVRRKSRLLGMVAMAAVGPSGKVTEVFDRDADRQGAYGLLQSEDVSYDAVALAMREGCARRCSGEQVVLVPVDGSSLNLADHQRAKGFGAVGTHHRGARGLKVISAMALGMDGTPMGLSGQVWWTRPNRRPKKHRSQRKVEDKEVRHWLEAMAQTREVFAAHAPQTKVWFQIDREGDAWPVLLQAGQGGHYLTVRASHNRRLISANGQRSYLRQRIGAQRVLGTYALNVPAGPKRTARVAHMSVRACKVTLDLRDKRTNRHTPTTLNAVLVREARTAPRGEKPIEWLLLTNYPVCTYEDACLVLLGYAHRWRIEDFHRTWKSGACNVEQTQLRSKQAVVKWATILAAVAVRIERLKHLSRNCPELPASEEFSERELRAIVLLRHRKKLKRFAPQATITIAQATRWVADLGGYTGKSSGGPPGSITLGRGLKRVEVAVDTLAALADA